MQVYNILASKGSHVITIQPKQTVGECIVLLAQHNIGALVVVASDERLAGIISERDIIGRAAKNRDIFSLLVEDVMTKEVIVCTSQDDLRPIAHTMTQNKIRHLPVVDEGKLVGIISSRDVVKAQRDTYEGEVETLQIQLSADT